MTSRKRPPVRRTPLSASGVAHRDGATPEVGMPHSLRTPRPDRDARAFLRWFNLASQRSFESYSLRELRLAWRLLAMAMGQRPAVESVSDRTIDGPGGPITMRVFSPGSTNQPRPAFLWCHGGGFMVGGPDTSDSICRSIARVADCVVIAVGYRLAPEHKLTAGREDFLAAVEWVAKNGAELGIDAARLAIGGDSAGGNICAAVAQRAVRNGGPALCLQVLAYPATDLVQEFPSLKENAHGAMITAGLLEQIKRAVPATPNPEDPWLSPRRSPDLRGLPPAVLVSAGFDPIRDDGLDYAARLRAAGVAVDLLHYPGQFHGFLNFDAVIGAGRDAIERIGHALALAFHGEPAADRTIEIADAVPRDIGYTRATAGEVAATSLTAWVALERWADTLLRLLSPRAAGAAGLLLLPVIAPATCIRRLVTAHLDRMAATQTYPAPGLE